MDEGAFEDRLARVPTFEFGSSAGSAIARNGICPMAAL